MSTSLVAYGDLYGEIESVETALEVTWDRPTRNICVSNTTEEEARRAAKVFDGKEVKEFTLQPVIGHSVDRKTWYTHIQNVPDSVTDKDLREMVLRDLEIWKAISSEFTWDPTTPSFQIIADKVKEFFPPTVIGAKSLPTFNPLIERDQLLFLGPSRLDSIARQLDKQQIPKLANSTIHVKEPIKVEMTFNAEVFERHYGELKLATRHVWRDHNVALGFTDSPVAADGPLVIDTIDGRYSATMLAWNRKDLMTAKKILDGIVSKTLLEDWIPSRPSRRVASPQTHRIRLSKPQTYSEALKTIDGANIIAQAKAKFGSDVVTLDEGSDPPALIVIGDTTTLRNVETFLRHGGLPLKEKTMKCLICWERTEDYVRLADCKHAACRECFVRYCSTDIEWKLPIRCFGTDCDVPVQMSQLQAELSEQDLANVLSVSVRNHFNHTPEKAAKCPSPECDMYYFINSPRQITCPKCFIAFCTACRVEFHFGECCHQYRQRVKESEHVEKLEKWIEETRAKRCKGCNAVVQKLDGCDNMQCYLCKAHFCWVCMQVCDTHKEVYSHLTAMHGGIHNDERERAEHDEEMERAYEEGEIAEALRREARDGVHPERNFHRMKPGRLLVFLREREHEMDKRLQQALLLVDHANRHLPGRAEADRPPRVADLLAPGMRRQLNLVEQHRRLDLLRQAQGEGAAEQNLDVHQQIHQVRTRIEQLHAGLRVAMPQLRNIAAELRDEVPEREAIAAAAMALVEDQAEAGGGLDELMRAAVDRDLEAQQQRRRIARRERAAQLERDLFPADALPWRAGNDLPIPGLMQDHPEAEDDLAVEEQAAGEFD